MNNKLVTDVFHKPTDAHTYLHFNSSHPRHIFKGIIFGQALRYRRIINNDELLAQRLGELVGYFVNCGYPKELLVKPIIDKVSKLERCLDYNTKSDNQPFHVPFFYTYGIGADEIKNYVDNAANKSLLSAPVFSSCSIPVLKTVFKKGPSLRSLVFTQKKVVLGSDSGGLSVRCTSIEVAMHKRGPKCQTCPNMSNLNSFTVNGMHYDKCSGGNCKSNNIIYLCICKLCDLAYFGKTTVPFHKRMNNHRDSMNNYDFNEAPPITDAHTLAYHALEHQNHPFNKCYTYFIVKEVSNPSELLATEQFFINKFNTKKPTGLNISNPTGVRVKRVRY